MRKLLSLLAALALLATGLQARSTQETRKIGLDGAEKTFIELDFGAGELTIVPTNSDQVAVIDLDYDSREVEYDITYDVRRGIGQLAIESDRQNHHDMDSEDNILDIAISTKYSTSLVMDIGACDAEMDLGGIPLLEFDLDVGAASAEIEFSEPNPVRMKELNIDAGAASVEMLSVGNANFDRFTFDGGAGSFEIDLRGEYSGESQVDIDIGLGSAEIILPRGVAVRVETDSDNWLSSVDFHSSRLDEVDDGFTRAMTMTRLT